MFEQTPYLEKFNTWSIYIYIRLNNPTQFNSQQCKREDALPKHSNCDFVAVAVGVDVDDVDIVVVFVDDDDDNEDS